MRGQRYRVLPNHTLPAGLIPLRIHPWPVKPIIISDWQLIIMDVLLTPILRNLQLILYPSLTNQQMLSYVITLLLPLISRVRMHLIIAGQTPTQLLAWLLQVMVIF